MHAFRLTTFVPVATVLVLSASVAAAADIPWRTPSAQIAGVAAPEASRAESLRALAARTDAHRIVLQFERPITVSERHDLEDAGVHLLAYLNSDAYFASLNSVLDADAAIAAAPIVSATPIDTTTKLHPALQPGQTPEWAIVVPGDDPTIGAYVMFHPDADLGAGSRLIDAN